MKRGLPGEGRTLDMGGEVVLFEAGDGQVRLDVRLERESVWLTLNQMAELFGRDKSLISRHLRNAFFSGELERAAVVARNATTAADGKACWRIGPGDRPQVYC